IRIPPVAIRRYPVTIRHRHQPAWSNACISAYRPTAGGLDLRLYQLEIVMQQEHTSDSTRPSAHLSVSSMKACASVVATSSWKLAIDLATEELRGLDAPATSPDLLIVFINDAWQEHYEEMLYELRQRIGATTVVGSSASGVLAGRHEYEDVPGISCLALWLPDVTVTPIRLHQESLPILDDPVTWHATTGVDAERVRGIFL